MRKITALAIATAAALAAAGSAHAQDYGYRYGGYNPTRTPDYVCSGNRARDVEAQIEYERREGDISPWRAERLHDQVDRTEDQTRFACERNDWRMITAIAGRYDAMQRMLREGDGY